MNSVSMLATAFGQIVGYCGPLVVLGGILWHIFRGHLRRAVDWTVVLVIFYFTFGLALAWLGVDARTAFTPMVLMFFVVVALSIPACCAGLAWRWTATLRDPDTLQSDTPVRLRPRKTNA